MANKNSGGIGEAIRTVLIAFLIAIGVRTFAYEPFNIPSGSMIPTLLVGDYLFVSKFSFGYSRHSLPFSLPLIPGRMFYTPPERGDVVVFKLPTDNQTDYIKRLVGLPGDRIQVKDGILHINGTAVERERLEDFEEVDRFGRTVPMRRYLETLPNGRQHEILEISDSQSNDNTPVYTVPEDHFFAMGDNRDNSVDSRYAQVGPVPRDNLVGRADLIFYSTDSARSSAWEVWEWVPGTRWTRLFTGIE